MTVSAGLGLGGLLSQFSRFLMKNGESLAEEHVSWVVSGIAAAVVGARRTTGRARKGENKHKADLHTDDVLAIESVLFFFPLLEIRSDTSDASFQTRKTPE